MPPRLEILPDAAGLAEAGAAHLADLARRRILDAGRVVIAFSGGRTPWPMFKALAGHALDWNAVVFVQVDERVAPADHPDRNLLHFRGALADRVPLADGQVLPMPVDEADLDAAADAYARQLEAIGGRPFVADVVHLGLGDDGHTASLMPGDPVLDEVDADVAVTTRRYAGWRRMTLTLPALNRARHRLWTVTGAARRAALARLLAGDRGIPAGLVTDEDSLVLTDRATADPAP